MNPGLYLDPDTAAFFKKETGIDDDVPLKEHIIGVQADAYKACTCQYHIEYLYLNRRDPTGLSLSLYSRLLLYYVCPSFLIWSSQSFICDGDRASISHSPAYADFLKLGREWEEAIFLEVGCCCMCYPCPYHCLSTAPYSIITLLDSRGRCQKGYRRWIRPMQDVIASDLIQDISRVVAGCAEAMIKTPHN